MNSSAFKSKWFCPVGLLCGILLLLSIGLVLSCWKYGVNHIVIIDAGSTGTRIYVFKFRRSDRSRHLTLIPPEAAKKLVPSRPGLRAYNRVETLPGLQRIARDVFSQHKDQDLLTKEIERVALGPLITWAKAVVPYQSIGYTEVHLLATGGVRGLDHKEQELVIRAASNVLEKSGFRFDPTWISVITGHEEGIYGWLALNHELGSFDSRGGALRSKRPAEPTVENSLHLYPESDISEQERKVSSMDDAYDYTDDSKEVNVPIGALDLGGSSMEATFPARGENAIRMEISGSLFQLASITFEKLGMNVAFEASLRLAADKVGNSTEVEYPCIHEGYSDIALLADSNITVKGVPSWEKCEKLVDEVIEEATDCKESPCFGEFNSFVKPLNLVGLNGFYVVWSFFRLQNGDSLQSLQAAGEEHCRRNWNSVKEEMGKVVHFDKYCFRSAFLLGLMSKIAGYRLEDSFYVASESVSWPIGAAFQLTQQKKRRHKLRLSHLIPMDKSGTWSWMHLLILLLGVTVLLVVVYRRIIGRSNRFENKDWGTSPLAMSGTFSSFNKGQRIKRRTLSYRKLHEMSMP